MQAVVFGNVTLDIICRTVDEVPRYESISFDQVAILPGGCGSNVAMGLASVGIPTTLVACCGDDNASILIERYWQEAGIDLRYLRKFSRLPTGTSIGLVDSDFQPRFIHTSGANAKLTPVDLDIQAYKAGGARALHIAGYFVLPGMLDARLAEKLTEARHSGILSSLDVVRSPRMKTPSSLWPCLPHLDIFLCNAQEGWEITGEKHPRKVAQALQARGANTIIVKLGSEGCWVESDTFQGQVVAPKVEVVDTTGAGDAFAAGLLSSLLKGASMKQACQAANQAASKIVGALGTLAGWGYR
jgi:sugar/nucleoside kinase (ribokinase family)